MVTIKTVIRGKHGEPPEHYAALHAAEAAFATGDMQEAGRLFKAAEWAADSVEAKDHCRWRRSATRPVYHKPEWHYRCFSNVQMEFSYRDGVWITANVVDLPSSAAAEIANGFNFEVRYDPLPRLEPWEYDPECCHSEIHVWGRMPLDARRRLKEVCAFMVRLAEAGRITEYDLSHFRPGDAFLAKHIRKRRATS